MDDEKWPTLPPDPSWVLEQIEMGAHQAGVPLRTPPAVSKKNREEIESAVTRLLQEELDRLDRQEAPREVPRKQ